MEHITLNNNDILDDTTIYNNNIGPNLEDSSSNNSSNNSKLDDKFDNKSDYNINNDIDDDESNNSDNESSNLDDDLNEPIDPELLEKMKEYAEKEEKQKNNDVQKIITNPIKEPLNIKPYKTIDEIKNESSILTKQELIKLGQTFATENKEKELFEEKKQKVINFLKKYENIDLDNIVDDIIKNKKNCNLKSILEHLFEYKRIYDNEINIYEEKIKKYQQEIIDIQDENKTNIKENEILNNKIETYWEPRVNKLRNKVIERNQYIKYLYIVLFISNLNTSIIGYLGMNKYIYIIKKTILLTYDLFIIVLKNIIFLSYMTFNNIYILSLTSLCITLFIYLIKNYTNYIKIFKTE